MTGRTQYAVDAQIKMSECVACQDDEHILTRVAYGNIRSTEQSKYGIYENERKRTENHAYQNIQRYGVAKKHLCALMVFLSKLERYHGAGAHAHH